MRAALRLPVLMRHAVLMLAMLAVAVRVFIPAGFMPSARVNDLPFPLVICTGHGELVVAAGQEMPETPVAPDGSARHAPCVFSGAVAGPLADGPVLQTSISFQYLSTAVRLPVSFEGGPGITGPPLPARGPPSLTI